MSEEAVPDTTLAAARAALSPFMATHPYSSVEAPLLNGKQAIRIVQPWGDSSLAITFKPSELDDASAINDLLLPERFTAIYHQKSKAFEIIFTAYPLDPESSGIGTRSFRYLFKEQEFRCAFSAASPELMWLAERHTPLKESATYFRNLQSFMLYSISKQTEQPFPAQMGEPLCFWIYDIEWDENFILSLVRSLNFHTSYFDNRSPIIQEHSPKLELPTHKRERFLRGDFPDVIVGRELDDNLVHYFLASLSGDTARRFLYSYRIIEYAAFLYIDQNVRSSIRKILSSPDVLSSASRASEKLLIATSEAKLNEVQKFDQVIRECVTPALLWKEIEKNLSVFTSEIICDGGYKIDSIAKVGWTEKDFAVNGMTSFATTIRNIRNALSHGRDQRSVSVITPTTHNFERIRPWASLLGVAASEVMIHRDHQIL